MAIDPSEAERKHTAAMNAAAMRRNKGIALRDQQARKAAAARAMLAALKDSVWIVEMAVDDDRFHDTAEAMRKAIAQAEAAGIK